MKRNLNIILLAVRAIIIVVGAICLYHLTSLYAVLINDYDAATIITSYFKPSAGIADVWAEPLFLGLYSALLGYLVFVLVRLYKSFDNLQKGNVFYPKQSKEFKAAGNGIIIFAKCKYLLFCSFGALPFHDFGIFFKEVAPFLVVYLLGKLILVLYYLAEKGEYLREETDLTV